jgi:aminotransferase in exopolysaccharide biosynthesis
MNTLTSKILDGVRSTLGQQKAALHEPTFEGNEWKYLKECLDSTYVSSVGKFVDQFETNLAEYTGAKYVISVVNGTAALHIALKLAGVSEGDEVLVPALTFVATANAVTYCNAIPHFVDSSEINLGMDAGKLRDYLKNSTQLINGKCVNSFTKKVISAMIPMHTFGHPADMESLLAISRDFNIALIEDAAESLGSYYFGKHTGTFGLFGIISFNGNKVITTGGGGAILTNDIVLAKRAKHITTTAKVPHRSEFIHDEIGYNYRMPNINAALGCAQLEDLQFKLRAKRRLFHLYKENLANISEIRIIEEPANCISNYWLQTIRINQENEFLREEVIETTNNEGYMTRPAWQLISGLKPYNNFPRMELDTSESLVKGLMNLPSGSGLISKIT